MRNYACKMAHMRLTIFFCYENPLSCYLLEHLNLVKNVNALSDFFEEIYGNDNYLPIVRTVLRNQGLDLYKARYPKSSAYEGTGNEIEMRSTILLLNKM